MFDWEKSYVSKNVVTKHKDIYYYIPRSTFVKTLYIKTFKYETIFALFHLLYILTVQTNQTYISINEGSKGQLMLSMLLYPFLWYCEFDCLQTSKAHKLSFFMFKI